MASLVLSWGIHDRSIEHVVELFVSRDAAEETLNVILDDKPEWANILGVVPLELGDVAQNFPIPVTRQPARVKVLSTRARTP